MFPAWAGLLLTLSRDLVEILQIALLLAGLLLIRQGRDRLAVTVLTVGAFTKETTLLSVVAIVLALWLQCQTGRWRIYVLPLCAYAVWQVVLALHWGQFPLQFGTRSVGVPLVGLVTFVQTIIPPGNRFQLPWLAPYCTRCVERRRGCRKS